jgi:hypothetical protein
MEYYRWFYFDKVILVKKPVLKPAVIMTSERQNDPRSGNTARPASSGYNNCGK